MRTLLLFCALYLPLSCFGQEIKYLGRILGLETQKPIPFADIELVGKGSKVQSNIAGYFEIVAGKQEIRISHIGYKTISFDLSQERPKFQLAIPALIYQVPELRLKDTVSIKAFHYNEGLYDKEISLRAEENAPNIIGASFPGSASEFHNYLVTGLFDLEEPIGDQIDATIFFPFIKTVS